LKLPSQGSNTVVCLSPADRRSSLESRMSVGRTDWNVPVDAANVVIGDELYLSNQTRINQVQEYLNSWNALNEEGNRNFNQIQSELARKVQEGEEAKRQLEALRNSSHNRPLAITASGSTSTSQFTAAPAASYSQQSLIVPITATIEEVTSPTQPVRSYPWNSDSFNSTMFGRPRIPQDKRSLAQDGSI